jgi:hypothetical protein
MQIEKEEGEVWLSSSGMPCEAKGTRSCHGLREGQAHGPIILSHDQAANQLAQSQTISA